MTTDAVGGIWTYALDLGRGLVQRGWRVTLALVGPEAGDLQRRGAAQAGLDIVNLDAPPEWLASGPDEVRRAGTALASAAQRRGADLIHLNHPALAAEVRFDAPVLAVCHSCVATWMAAVRGVALPPELEWQAALVARGYAAPDILVAPSHAFAEATRQVYGLRRLPAVVPNGRLSAPPVAAGTPANAAFTAGRLWDAGKNAIVLDRAAARMTAKFRAAGPVRGPNGAPIDLPNLDLLGSVDEAGMRALLGERPVYVSAALYEPFGLAILEAAQAGCALVLSDIPSLRELWGETAIFVDAGDDRGFAEAIEGVLAEPERRMAFAEASRVRSETYTLERFVGGMEAMYIALLAAGESRPLLSGETAPPKTSPSARHGIALGDPVP